MQLMPRKVKFRKALKGKNRGVATRGADINFGDYALKAMGDSQACWWTLYSGRIFATHIYSVSIDCRAFVHRVSTSQPFNALCIVCRLCGSVGTSHSLFATHSTKRYTAL